MTPEKFVAGLRKTIVEKNLKLYRETLNEPDSESDIEYWKRTSRLFKSLKPSQREHLLAIMRQVMVDTLSNVLGILDGSSSFEKNGKDFVLKYGSDPKKLNGDLQDYFLALEEELAK